MPTFVIPDLYCPFPSVVNRHAEQVHAYTIEWINRFGLFSEHARRRLPEVKFAWLAAHVSPKATQTELQLLADWNIWLFARDDLCEETAIRNNPEQMHALNSRLLAVLDNGETVPTDMPLVHSLADLRQRILSRTTPNCMTHFVARVKDYFDSNVWEATNLGQGLYPDMVTYIAMRHHTGALYTAFELAIIIEQIQLSEDIREHPAFQSLAIHANNVVCWANDIISLDKEIRCGEIHNLVLIIQRQYQLSLQEAVNRVAEMHNAEVRAFITEEAQLTATGVMVDANLERLIDVMRFWMRGNLDWALMTARYQPGSRMYGART